MYIIIKVVDKYMPLKFMLSITMVGASIYISGEYAFVF